MGANSWDEVLNFIRSMNLEPQPVGTPAGTDVYSPQSSHPGSPSREAFLDDGEAPRTPVGEDLSTPAGSSWTLVWISDQAFKPAAVTLKSQLESLGCQVKGYKTNRNAARALDKKRMLARTVVLVCGTEAPALLQYLNSRPELSGTRVVVEASSRMTPVVETATCTVAEGFDEAVAEVRRIAMAP